MNNISRQKVWLLLLLVPPFIGIIIYVLSPFFKNHDPWLELPVMISLILAWLTLIGLLFTRFEANFNNLHGQFIKLLDIHRGNVQSINLDSYEKSYPILSNHYFFQIVLDEFEMVRRLVGGKLKNRKDNDVILFTSIQREKEAANRANLYLEDLTVINISYLIVFFGMEKGKDSLRSALQKTYHENVIEDVFEWIEEWKNLEQIKKSIPLHGFQGVLGHYYRHLFGTVKFINEPRFIAEDYKSEMGSLLRGQLSTFEQSLLLINSLSILGRKWEIESLSPNQNLISRYNLIRNIPSEFFIGVDPKQIYTNVEYE